MDKVTSEKLIVASAAKIVQLVAAGKGLPRALQSAPPAKTSVAPRESWWMSGHTPVRSSGS